MCCQYVIVITPWPMCFSLLMHINKKNEFRLPYLKCHIQFGFIKRVAAIFLIVYSSSVVPTTPPLLLLLHYMVICLMILDQFT